MKKIINLTPHVISIVATIEGGEEIIEIPISGIIARVKMEREQVGTLTVNGHIIPIIRQYSTGVENLPAPVSDVFYVVSQMVADQSPQRKDLLVPGDLKRDENGEIIGMYDIVIV